MSSVTSSLFGHGGGAGENDGKSGVGEGVSAVVPKRLGGVRLLLYCRPKANMSVGRSWSDTRRVVLSAMEVAILRRKLVARPQVYADL
jgi:hypothetical protein